MIFMLLSPMWGCIHEMEGKFGHEPWPRMCGQINLKFYKKQTKSENHKICHDIIISKVETVVKKIWEGFAYVVKYTPYRSKKLRRRSIDLRSRSDFESKWHANSGLNSKIHILDSFMPNFNYFSDLFDNLIFLQLNNIMWYTLKLSYDCMK